MLKPERSKTRTKRAGTGRFFDSRQKRQSRMRLVLEMSPPPFVAVSTLLPSTYPQLLPPDGLIVVSLTLKSNQTEDQSS
jgi:hypothetical protein